MPSSGYGPFSWFRVSPGRACDLTLEVFDDPSGTPVNWVGRALRFRIFSQFVDRFVVVEITDPARCTFPRDGIWSLRLTEQETASMPRGGMLFTLEHRDSHDSQSQYQLGLQGGISCNDVDTTNQRAPLFERAREHE